MRILYRHLLGSPVAEALPRTRAERLIRLGLARRQAEAWSEGWQGQGLRELIRAMIAA